LAKKETEELQPIIIIKKVKKVADGGHHGAWKVAYADFVTAMMAFFLMLWLLNVTTDEAKDIISSYFDPSHRRVSDSRSGAGGVLGGLSISPDGAQITNLQPIHNPEASGAMIQNPKQGEESTKEIDNLELKKLEEELRKQEEERFKQAAEELRKLIEDNDELKGLLENLVIDITPEGLRIQLIDKKGRPMFPSGSASMYGYTRKLLEQVAIVANTLPNDISVRGHTDSHKYAPGASYTNWELSADRANASRRVLTNSNVDESRIANVMGKSSQDPFIKDNPRDPQNRRISILMLRESMQHAFDRGAFGDRKSKPKETLESTDGFKNLPRPEGQPRGTFQRTPGEVYFP